MFFLFPIDRNRIYRFAGKVVGGGVVMGGYKRHPLVGESTDFACKPGLCIKRALINLAGLRNPFLGRNRTDEAEKDIYCIPQSSHANELC